MSPDREKEEKKVKKGHDKLANFYALIYSHFLLQLPCRHFPAPSQHSRSTPAPHLAYSCSDLSHAHELCQSIFKSRDTYILTQPSETFTIALSHDDGAHENFNRSDVAERNLALAGSLVKAELVSELLL